MFFRLVLLFSVSLFLYAGCQRAPKAAPEINFLSQDTVSIRQLPNTDLGYLLTHVEIAAESPLPHLLPPEMKSHYRVLGVTEQGNCDPACPRSIVFVAIWHYSDYPDGHIQLYRIDGVRFWHFLRVEEFKPDENNGYFLSFRFQSRPHPNEPEDYLAKVGFSHIAVERAPQKNI